MKQLILIAVLVALAVVLKTLWISWVFGVAALVLMAVTITKSVIWTVKEIL